MRKKYYIKKKRKLVSSYKILVFLICILLLIAVGYSISTTTLTIIARVNLQKQTDINLPSEKSKSSATWEIMTAPWGDGFTTYNIQFTLENKDESVNDWTISMDFPPCVIQEEMEVWGAVSYEIERVGDYDRITFHAQEWNAQLDLGETLDELGFNIRLNGKTNMEIDHLIFNNKLVTDFKQIGNVYNVEDGKTEDNEINQNTTIENTITNETNQNTTTENTITNEIGGGTTETGDSKVTWETVNTWGTTYQIKLKVENNDKACNEWTLSIDVPHGVDESTITSWTASAIEVKTMGEYDRVTFTSAIYNGNVDIGQILSTEIQITYLENVNFNIYKVIFNGEEISNISKTN